MDPGCAPPEIRYRESGEKDASSAGPAVKDRPLSNLACTWPSKASSRYTRPSRDTAISFPSLEKVTLEMDAGLLSSWSICSSTVVDFEKETAEKGAILKNAVSSSG